ncbi:hypothetical protein L204_102719 [Cryptococcus depauperatus]
MLLCSKYDSAIGDSSDDDEAGVFFGKHKSEEAELAARMEELEKIRRKEGPSNFTTVFDSLHLSSAEESDEAESDKENMPLPISNIRWATDAVWPKEPTMTPESLVLDGEKELDMGGLKLSDFADQDIDLVSNHLDPLGRCVLEELGSSTLTPIQSSLLNITSPLEVARGGVVVIPPMPHYLASICADTGSPCRDLPPSPIYNIPPIEMTTVQLANLESPTKPKGPPIWSTPSRPTLASNDLIERGAKMLKSSTVAKRPATNGLNTKRSTEMRKVIKTQLDSALNVRKTLSQSSAPSCSGLELSVAAKIFDERAQTGHLSASSTCNPSMSRPQLRPEPRPIKKVIPKPTVSVKNSKSQNKTLLPRPKAHLTKPPMPPPPLSIPLKRPASSQSLSHPPSQLVPCSASMQQFQNVAQAKHGLGQPFRALQAISIHNGLDIPGGVEPSPMSMSRIAFRSPARQSVFRKSVVLGEVHTPKKLGTPFKFDTPRQASQGIRSKALTVNCTASSPIAGVSLKAPPPSRVPIPVIASFSATVMNQTQSADHITEVKKGVAGPENVEERRPASSIKQSTEKVVHSSPSSSTSRPSRSGSVNEHHTEFTTEYWGSPCSSPRRSTRAKRSICTKLSITTSSPEVSVKALSTTYTSTPPLTQKQLRTATARNTAKNQVYHCAIDRKVIRQPGPRPPSPTSKIRTVEEKDELEKKKSREDRAKRRMGSNPKDQQPVVAKMQVRRAPGDESDYEYTSSDRPVKRTKLEEQDGKRLRWDTEVMVIRDDGLTSVSTEQERTDREKVMGKSCIKFKVPLDEYGNALDSTKPIENLKRQRVVVTAVFYDGEEPVSAPCSSTRSKKKVICGV